MSNIRPPKPTDQEETTKIFDLFREFFGKHNVEGNIMCSAMMSLIADKYQESGHSYEDYCWEMKEMTNYYKVYWEKP